MNQPFTAIVDEIRDRLSTGPGSADTSLRTAAIRLGAEPAGDNHDIPNELRAYLEKVSLTSYRVMDSDIESLKAAGYSEDDLYELTVCVAFGAGLERLQRGLALLEQ